MHVRPLVVTAVLVVSSFGWSASPLVAQSSGVYTTAQAAQGATIVAAQCSSCHGDKLEGSIGPQLVGADFIAKWSGQTAADVHAIIASQMPQNDPGSLSAAEALAVMAYILQQNHYPAGSVQLTAATLKTVKISKQ